MKRYLSVLILLSVLCMSLVPCQAENVGTSAAAAIMMDCDTGEILYEKNSDTPMGIASTTKIITALVALECARLDDETTFTAEHVTEGSSMYLRVGEKVTVEELLYGLMLCSGNDAAVCLADYCAGDVESFVTKMNDLAHVLEMKNTAFENPNGLDGTNHHSTARDMALLAAYAANDPTFRRICSSKSATIGGRTMTNHNRLLRELPGCVGMKTGYTMACGRTLVSCCERNDRRLTVVTLNDGNDWVDHKKLYKWAFGEE